MTIKLLYCQVMAVIVTGIVLTLEAEGRLPQGWVPHVRVLITCIGFFMLVVSTFAYVHHSNLQEKYEHLNQECEKLTQENHRLGRCLLDMIESARISKVLTVGDAVEKMGENSKSEERESVWTTLKDGGLLP